MIVVYWDKAFFPIKRGGSLLPPRKLSAFKVKVIIFVIIWTTVTILVQAWGVVVNMTDDYHIQYGFPLIWTVHMLATIGGPVDSWSISYSALLINMAFWLGSMIVVLSVLYHISIRKSQQIVKM
jgi:hypothetical protein